MFFTLWLYVEKSDFSQVFTGSVTCKSLLCNCSSLFYTLTRVKLTAACSLTFVTDYTAVDKE